jgi:hypothetical protein
MGNGNNVLPPSATRTWAKKKRRREKLEKENPNYEDE